MCAGVPNVPEVSLKLINVLTFCRPKCTEMQQYEVEKMIMLRKPKCSGKYAEL